MFEWKTKYNQGFIPDKHGRWASELFCGDFKLAEVIRYTVKGDTFYRVTTFFPVNREEMPLLVKTFDSWQEVKEKTEKEFIDFIQKIRNVGYIQPKV